MKPHVTNFTHQNFILLLENNIHKMEEIPNEQKSAVLEKIAELKNNKDALEEIYTNYQLKLKELSNLLDDYEKTHRNLRTNLRKVQLWLKCSYSKILNDFF